MQTIAHPRRQREAAAVTQPYYTKGFRCASPLLLALLYEMHYEFSQMASRCQHWYHVVRILLPQEVEKEVAEEIPGKKPRKRTLRQMEYCFEAELEGLPAFSTVLIFVTVPSRACHGCR